MSPKGKTTRVRRDSEEQTQQQTQQPTAAPPAAFVGGAGGATEEEQQPTGPDSTSFSVSWQDEVKSLVKSYFKSLGAGLGIPATAINAWVDAHWGNAFNNWAMTYIVSPQLIRGVGITPAFIQSVTNAVIMWYLGNAPGAEVFRQASAGKAVRGGGGGGGVGRVNLRGQFDLNELAMRANDLAQAYLLKDLSNAKEIAKSYVDLVVSRPDQRVDFETYVINEFLKKDPRWSTIYRFKPEGVPERQYLAQYAQHVLSVLGGGQGFDNPSEIAVNQAALGTSPETVSARLQRTRTVTSGSGFLNRLERRLAAIGEVFR